jgi:hypothetical protein
MLTTTDFICFVNWWYMYRSCGPPLGIKITRFKKHSKNVWRYFLKFARSHKLCTLLTLEYKYFTYFSYVLLASIEETNKIWRSYLRFFNVVLTCVVTYQSKRTNSRSQLPRGLRLRSTAAHLLWSCVRIPPGAWMFVCCVCCQVEVSSTSWSLVQRSPTDYGASLCVIKKHRGRGGHSPRWAAEPKMMMMMMIIGPTIWTIWVKFITFNCLYRFWALICLPPGGTVCTTVGIFFVLCRLAASRVGVEPC